MFEPRGATLGIMAWALSGGGGDGAEAAMPTDTDPAMADVFVLQGFSAPLKEVAQPAQVGHVVARILRSYRAGRSGARTRRSTFRWGRCGQDGTTSRRRGGCRRRGGSTEAT